MIRWVFRIFLALVACVCVAFGLLFLLPSEQIGQLASEQLEKQTGRKLTLTGEFRPTLYPILGVKTGQITVSNAEWASEPQMIVASKATVGVNLMALIGGDLEIEKLELTDPLIYLERGKDGQVNWDLGGPENSTEQEDPNTDTETGNAIPSLTLGKISNGHIVYTDQTTGHVTDIADITGTVALPKGAGSAVVDMAAILDGRAVAVDIEVKNWAQLLDGGQSTVKGQTSIAQITVGFDGLYSMEGTFPTLSTHFSVTAASLSDSLQQLNLSTPDPMKPLRDTDLKGQLQFSDAGLYLEAALDTLYSDAPVHGTITASMDEVFDDAPILETTLDIVSADTASVSFDGLIGLGKDRLNGSLNASAQDLRKVLKLAGLSLSTPAGTAQKGAVSGAVTLSDTGAFQMSDAKLTLDQNTVSGTMKGQIGGVTSVTAAFVADQLDVSAYVADGQKTGGETGADATEQGWSKAPISLQGLTGMNADVTLKAKGINLGVTQLGATNVGVKLQDGTLAINLVDVRAYQGALAGSVRVQGGKSVAFSSDIRAKDVQLEPMLSELLDIDRLRGSGNVTLNLSGQGNSLHQIMTGLSGKGNVAFGKGAIRGIDLAAMMRNLKKAFGGFDGATEFSSLTGSFEITKGVLQNVDLSLISPLFKASGRGSIDLGGQAMNYVVTPSSLSQEAEFSVPVTISGPWQDLKFRPDLEKLINLALEKKLRDSEAAQQARQKLEDVQQKLANPEETIEAEIREKIAEETGGNVETLEDDLKKKLEDEVGNALQKLFD